MSVVVQRIASALPLPHFARTPSLTSSDDTSTSSDFEVHVRKSLPPLPVTKKLPSKASARPLLAGPRDRSSSTRTTADARRSRTLSSFLPLNTRILQTALLLPGVLASLIEYLPWVYFYALTCTCRDFRHILRTFELKDIVLSQFVPGYKLCLQHRDMQRFRDVPITISHLDSLRE